MSGVLLLVFLVVPFVELFVIVQVGQVIGGLPVVALLLAMSVAGGWLVKREGVGVWRRARGRIQGGELPGTEVADAVLVVFGGALLLTPGFLTDALGLALLLPPVRAVIRPAVVARLQAAALGGVFGGATGGRGFRRPGRSGVIDL